MINWSKWFTMVNIDMVLVSSDKLDLILHKINLG